MMVKQLDGLKPQDTLSEPVSITPLPVEDLSRALVALRYDIIDIRPLYNSQTSYLNGSHVLLEHAFAHMVTFSTLFDSIRIPSHPFVIYLNSHYPEEEEYVLVRSVGEEADNFNVFQFDFYNTGFIDILGCKPYISIIFSSYNSSPYKNAHQNMRYIVNLENYAQDLNTYDMCVNLKDIVCAAICAVMESTTKNRRCISGKIGRFAKTTTWINTPITVKASSGFYNNIMVELSYCDMNKTTEVGTPNRATRRSNGKSSINKPGKGKKYFWE